MTYAQAVGEAPTGSPSFVAGVDFDPSDPDEVEVVKLASQTHGAERMRYLEAENARLRGLVENLSEQIAENKDREEDEEHEDVEAGYFAPEPWEMTDGLDMPSYGS